MLLSFGQFFFQRRKLIFTFLTILWFYIFGIFSALFISYTQFEWLLIFQIYFFFMIIEKTSILTSQGKVDNESIEIEKQNRKWYQKIWATNTQQRENKQFIIDFGIFIVFMILLLLIKDNIS